MKKISQSFKIILFALVVCLGIAVIFFGYPSFYQELVRPVLADDEKEDKDEDEDEDGEERKHFDVINTESSKKETEKNEIKTITTKLSDTVTQITTTTIRHDSDGDGKYDDEDPHPTINEYFIVEDDNLNGVDDQYEQK